MKIIEKISLVLFSTIMLILSLVVCLLTFGWLEVQTIADLIIKVLNNSVSSNLLLGLSIVFILMAIKCIFFGSSDKETAKADYKNGILLENADGKLLITRETIENLVSNIVKGFDSAEDITTKIELDNENNLIVYVNLSVRENANIKELSTNLQTKIKETVKKTSDLVVKEVNIKVKDVEAVKQIVQE